MEKRVSKKMVVDDEITLDHEKQMNSKFKVCKAVNHRTIQLNHQPDSTIF
jgi:hypothetical protein